MNFKVFQAIDYPMEKDHCYRVYVKDPPLVKALQEAIQTTLEAKMELCCTQGNRAGRHH